MSLKQSNRALQVSVATGALLIAPVTWAGDSLGTVYTPKGSAVSVILFEQEATLAQIASMNQWVEATYPNATRMTAASRKYNCHSYSWYQQSANGRWMNDPGDNTYWNDKSYVQTSPELTPGWPNGKVSYVWGDHSAVKYDATRFQSKWGAYPVMRHAPGYSPYDSTTLRYYTRYNLCPSGNGSYCGDPLRGQSASYLYSCSSGAYSLVSTCNNKGCKRNPPGVNDACKP